ncbi:MAG: 1-acyl-sn-glycerol-3-phosphate acyltransferase [Neptuniibacter sp.]
MLRTICRYIFNKQGWKIRNPMPEDIGSCVVVGAPHTSNWDFVYAVGAWDLMGITNLRFTIKKEWMIFPFKLFLEPLGAIGIDRSPKTPGDQRPSMVDEMAKLFAPGQPKTTLLVTPEGTRSPVKRWKRGFYHVALKSNTPICLAYLDFKKREAGIGMVIYPSGDIDKDFRKIWDFYNQVTPYNPDNYIPL